MPVHRNKPQATSGAARKQKKKSSSNQVQHAPPPKIIEDHSLVKKYGRIKQYALTKLLGRGGFAKVYGVKSMPSGNIYAVKIVTKANLHKASHKEKLKHEIRIHRELNHKNIVKFIKHFEDLERVYILLEHCDYQTLMELHKRRRRITEPEIQFYMLQMLEGVGYLHNNNVIHRDMKLGNVLLGENLLCKIADFGLATKLRSAEERKTTICGTPNYIAPEVLYGSKNQNGGKVGHSFEVDIWSLGVIMYTLLVGQPPFQTGTVTKTYKMIRGAKFAFPVGMNVSTEAQSLVNCILQLKEEKRPGIDDIVKHTFFSIVAPPKTLPVSSLKTRPDGFPQMITDSLQTAAATTKRKRSGVDTSTSSGASKRMRLAAENPRRGLPATPNRGKESDQKKEKHEKWSWICKWLDYTRKYGVGYVCNNGGVGVYFNDYTKILLHPDKSTVSYWSANASGIGGTKCSLKEYPSTLKKKITLLRHFDGHFTSVTINLEGVKECELQDSELVYVKDTVKTQNAMMFRLNTKTVQMNFKDNSELLLCTATNKLSYTDVKGSTNAYSLPEVLKSHDLKTKELRRRLQYTQDLLKNRYGKTTSQ